MEYGDLNENCPHKPIDLNTWSSESGTFRRIKRCDLGRGSMSLVMGLEVSEAPTRLSASLFTPPADSEVELSQATSSVP